MMLTQALVKQNSIGYCSSGMERLEALMAEIGATDRTPIPMRLILDRLGVSDCTFGFCGIKSSLTERDKKLSTYMQYLFQELCSFVPDLMLQYPAEFKAIRKRCEGHNRPHLIEGAYKKLRECRRYIVGRNERHALFGLMLLAAPHPDYLCAVHAGICLMDAGGHAHYETMMRAKLEELV